MGVSISMGSGQGLGLSEARNNGKKKKKKSKFVTYNGRRVSRAYAEKMQAADTARKKAASDHNKAWKQARKEGRLAEFEDKHRTKKAKAIYKSASEKHEAFKKENKRGKYSDRAKKAKKTEIETHYGKGWKRTLGQIKRGVSGQNWASKDVKALQKSKKQEKEKLKIRKKKAIERIKSRIN